MPDDDTNPLLVEIAIEPKSRADRERLAVALAELVAEDALFRVSTDHESGQTILKGTSQDQLERKVDLLRRTHRIDAHVGAPQVAFLERPTVRAEVEYAHKKVTGRAGQFAAVNLAVEPNRSRTGYRFESRITDAALPKQYLPGVLKGVESVLRCGVVAGFPVVDTKVELLGAKYHDTDSSALAFEIAARAALREALQKASSVLLEPIMKVEVVTPNVHAGAITGDLNARRAQIEGHRISGTETVVSAMVPLMAMFDYDKALRTISEGRATFTMRYDHYAPAPPLSPGDGPFRPAVGMRA